MPSLKNHKHEAFCEFIVAGKTIDESYQLAGFKPHRGNASRLRSNEIISARIAALGHKTVVVFEITAEKIAEMLLEDRQFAIDCGSAGAATQATMGLAKIGGLLVDQASVSVHHTYSSMSEEEIRFEIAALVAEARALKPGVQN